MFLQVNRSINHNYILLSVRLSMSIQVFQCPKRASTIRFSADVLLHASVRRHHVHRHVAFGLARASAERTKSFADVKLQMFQKMQTVGIEGRVERDRAEGAPDDHRGRGGGGRRGSGCDGGGRGMRSRGFGGEGSRACTTTVRRYLLVSSLR